MSTYTQPVTLRPVIHISHIRTGVVLADCYEDYRDDRDLTERIVYRKYETPMSAKVSSIRASRQMHHSSITNASLTGTTNPDSMRSLSRNENPAAVGRIRNSYRRSLDYLK